MKLLLLGPDAKIRRILSLSATSAELTSVAHGRDLATVPGLGDHHTALIEWEGGEAPAEALASLRQAAPELPVIALVTSAAEGAKAKAAGARDVVSKPVNVDAFRELLEQVALPSRKTASVRAEPDPVKFVTQSAAMEAVLSVAWRVAPTPASVLILGENGTGKTMLARAIHARSTRKPRPFVTVNCPCLQPQLLESELFGHVRGSFTGAVNDTSGKVAAAEGGTLFLDEVGELPLSVQAKLLRLLQERCYERVGEARTHRADIRVLAATNRDLKQLVAAGQFREDLYYRLNVITIEMPPLRSRPEDIIPTAEYFLEAISREARGPRRDLTLAARDVLLAHSWPGNLRQLRNVIERAAILCDREWLDACDFAELTGRVEGAIPQVGEFVTLEVLIEAHIRSVTARAESYEQAARILGIDKSTLYRWRKRLDPLEPEGVAEFAG
ncbi:MAG TPA: sigma-54 dependent transcriptional regulator [Opitutus sp.]|nr:sigma-54 dependent transcriptional regulator [Opitutus sp.]